MSQLLLGNLSVKQIEERIGIEFPEEIRGFMEQTHQSEASNVEKGKWHCFDIPFTIVFGDMETATKIYNSVKDRSSECKVALQFSLQERDTLA
ncbi:hypothetical protein UFOVP683_42 [uncultured Caudovirales phage]|uniref:Uncharacterized protein n=1 Tax=uncultured Caudovirales phage TaxID=2100421 RepID=A0A6J5NJ15_9CAUD|nr:hypothetical protein UFOVP683_42 [uncultured Caudovirales phage]